MLDKEKNNSKAKDVVEHIKGDEVKLKFLSFCCVLNVVLLIIISGQIFYIYKSLNSLIDLVEDGEYNRVSEVFYEEKKPEDLLPILEVTSTTEKTTKIDSDNSTTTTKVNESSISISNAKTYVINRNSKKIHTKDCSFVNRISEDNKQIVQLTNDELSEYKNSGYTLCSSCGG